MKAVGYSPSRLDIITKTGIRCEHIYSENNIVLCFEIGENKMLVSFLFKRPKLNMFSERFFVYIRIKRRIELLYVASPSPYVALVEHDVICRA